MQCIGQLNSGRVVAITGHKRLELTSEAGRARPLLAPAQERRIWVFRLLPSLVAPERQVIRLERVNAGQATAA